ncbi:NAD(P)-dependent oxidoreductase [Arthrobacter sp. K5]|uniref:NAD(P)-dependent oxidoreductase n=1 Tax=Arthrobacter sp. K5 TaxID=2839623 RepID=A0AAU8EWI1_9MICC
MPETLRNIAFIGLGKMGTPMASRLISSGYQVRGFDLAEEARSQLAEAGGIPAENPASAVSDADAVILMLPTSAIVESVILSEEVLNLLPAKTLIIDMSSSEPLRTVALAEKVSTLGHKFIDAPVSGGVKGAEQGTLTIMVGGAGDDVESARPLLGALGRPTHIGPTGAGHALKALNNLLSATHLWITSEAMLVGEKFGIDPKTMLDAFNSSSGRSGSTENKWPNFILPETYNSGFGLGLMVKDMGIALTLASSLGIPAVLGQEAVALWKKAQSDLPPDADHTEIAKWLRSHPGSPE